MLRDRAALTSLETRLPVIQNTARADYLELAQSCLFGAGTGRAPENPLSQKHCKCRRGSALGALVLAARSHPASVRNVLGTSINKSFES